MFLGKKIKERVDVKMPCILSNNVKRLDFLFFSTQAVENKVNDSKITDTTMIVAIRTKCM
jgi:hypothetical protein